jgi:type III secretory pathway component EscT
MPKVGMLFGCDAQAPEPEVAEAWEALKPSSPTQGTSRFSKLVRVYLVVLNFVAHGKIYHLTSIVYQRTIICQITSSFPIADHQLHLRPFPSL